MIIASLIIYFHLNPKIHLYHLDLNYYYQSKIYQIYFLTNYFISYFQQYYSSTYYYYYFYHFNHHYYVNDKIDLFKILSMTFSNCYHVNLLFFKTIPKLIINLYLSYVDIVIINYFNLYILILVIKFFISRNFQCKEIVIDSVSFYYFHFIVIVCVAFYRYFFN